MTNISSKPKVKETLQLYFLQRLHRLLSNGYSLIKALDFMQWDKQLKPYASEMKQLLIAGKTIDEALEELRFHHLIVTYLYFVRYNGSLIENIEKCMALFEQRLTYVRKFLRVLRYPFVLMSCFIILLFF